MLNLGPADGSALSVSPPPSLVVFALLLPTTLVAPDDDPEGADAARQAVNPPADDGQIARPISLLFDLTGQKEGLSPVAKVKKNGLPLQYCRYLPFCPPLPMY